MDLSNILIKVKVMSLQSSANYILQNKKLIFFYESKLVKLSSSEFKTLNEEARLINLSQGLAGNIMIWTGKILLYPDM